MAPGDDSNPAGTSHTITANVTSGGLPLPGQRVTFTVTGQNSGAVGVCLPADCMSDANGDVTFTYTDTNGAGDDTIKASFTDSNNSLQSATAQKHWLAACGDGTVDPSEQCDDGNTVDGDGCSATCQIETCYRCTGAPSACTPNDGAACDDGLFCNGADTCSGGSCSVHGVDPCAAGAECNNVCDEAHDSCHVMAGTACTDDGNVCTDDQCDGAGACGHAANTASCDDGVFCNGADTCSGGACTVHAGDPCAAGAECNNACNESAGNCHVAANTACTNDGNPCSRDVCDGGGACAHPAGNAGATCRTAAAECDAAEVCDGTHTACPADAAKPNGTACAGTNHNTCLNACQAGSCVPDFRTACCGNGVLEAGEQCEDGNQVAGDGCRANCTYELIPGDGNGVRSRDSHACLVEWSVVNPNNQPATDLRGRPHYTQRCKNNDPTCDFDGSATDDTCEFHVVACLNNVDPQLASCSQAGVADPVRVLSPLARDAANHASLVNALQSLRDSTGATFTLPLSEDETNVCTAPFSIRVPLRRTGQHREAGRVRLITRARSSLTLSQTSKDSDLINLMCEP
ncbi:MAG: DUF4215 domain-containing protein [Deltaproteobacteria bacterium]|nr:DUF4215 domain-containing protein [Deltaproteobacteria bacterium]MBI3390943.1 DUF4215 domain-containing protein [Deltaproteobacteria bacterium]